MFWINYNFQVQSRFILYTLDSDLFWKSDNCKKERLLQLKKKKKLAMAGTSLFELQKT